MQNRYSRQILFQPIGEKGQAKLQQKTVLVAGAGALGTVASNHLVRAGVGHVRIVDRDFVEYSNLQRQMLYTEQDAKDMMPKAVAAENRLKEINPDVSIEGLVADITSENIEKLMDGVDVVIDGTDNFSTRYLLNDASFKLGIPFAYGGAVSSRGMTAFFVPGETPCLRCVVPDGAGSGQTCDTVGVIAPVVDMVSSFQVTEIMKYLTNNHKALRRDLYSFDIWHNQQFSMKLKDPVANCTTCQTKTFPYLHTNIEQDYSILCGRDSFQIHKREQFDLNTWQQRLQTIAEVKKTPFLLKATLDSGETLVLFPDGRVLVQEVDDITRAKAIYDRLIGS
ncbi:adenylyltransferase and sulfurtransferase [Thalassobacillus cyri]|uniref:Adenylyltransferase and sulfurtransferase n=1 Tax=Thalassobacillus cyri TaxID=571932 RepID=A0A1H4FJ61_9BACI|nr:ThiF family adenylyltransferase [Thalassobacillus cyri]SEA97393.1 adenylyltransferase and sulfurtransferase [Thalassobacillus cyri]